MPNVVQTDLLSNLFLNGLNWMWFYMARFDSAFVFFFFLPLPHLGIAECSPRRTSIPQIIRKIQRTFSRKSAGDKPKAP